jgi:hypothetical protein
MKDKIIEIIEKHLDLDTVHIEYHRESIDMVGHMADEIMELTGKVWLVGRWSERTWEIEGIYTDEADAREEAKDGWFLVGLETNRLYPESEEWVTEYRTREGWEVA